MASIHNNASILPVPHHHPVKQNTNIVYLQKVSSRINNCAVIEQAADTNLILVAHNPEGGCLIAFYGDLVVRICKDGDTGVIGLVTKQTTSTLKEGSSSLSPA